MTVLGALARFVATADITSLPGAQREIARHHFIDTIIALLSGLRTPEGARLKSLLGEAAWPEAAGLVSAAIRLTEIDDIHLPSCTTPSSVAVPVALSVGSGQARSASLDLAVASWVGTELISRLGEAVSGPSILYRGIWPTYLAAPFGAAAVASRMLGLDGTQTAHAFSLALMLCSGGIGQFRGDPSGRWFIFGMAVTQGIRAAISAREGLLGDLSLLDGPWFMQTHGIEAKTQPFQRIDLQRSVYSGLSIKPFCSSKQCIASVESLREILDRGVSPDEITRVAVTVPTAYANMIRTKAQPHARSSTLVSAAHQLALAAWKPEGLYDVDRVGSIDDPKIVSFAAKVEVVADAQLMTRYPEFWPARLEVQAGGKVHHAEITSAKGDPANPLSQSDIDTKAHRILDGKRGMAAVDRWLAVSK